MAKRRKRNKPKRVRARRRKNLRWPRWVAGGCLALILLTALPLLLLRFVPPPTTAFMLRSRHADPSNGLACEKVHQRWAPWEAIAPDLALAVLVAEDQRFLDHHGVDFEAIRRALRERWRDGRVRGASTLTQQLVKNLFLSPKATYGRKAVEAWFAVWIEALWPKRRILEVYLNVVQFGPCTFGAAAASERYFQRSPIELSSEQAARLAMALPSPAKLRAQDPGPYGLERTAEILTLMHEHRWRLRRL